MKKFFLAACLSVAPVFISFGHAGTASAQSTVSGDISGTVTDPTGAIVSGAVVTVENLGTGSTSKVTVSATGAYRVSLLPPGQYKVSVTAEGFETTTLALQVNQGAVVTGDVKLSLGKSATTVEVASSDQPLLQTEDSQISTTFNMQQVQTLPNPGGDVTYYAQTAPGVVMNTGGGYGNFSEFGLPGTSNNFTVNGFQENDPFLNLNNSGPTNLLLGQNDVDSVNVIGTAYGAEFGSFGGVQESIITRSGTNKFHGNLNYYWNGRTLNANDYFFNTSGVGRPFTNGNQWAAAVGGPIFKDKTFFFINTEGLRFITAPLDFNVVPSPAYEQSIVGVGASGQACGTGSSLVAAGSANECGYYNNIFALYNGAPGIGSASVLSGDPNALGFYSSPTIFAKESLLTARVDHRFSDKNSVFFHYKYDNGTQPTHVDPINTAFNNVSYQPEQEGQIVYTHIFTPNITNQLNLGIAHYSAFFQSVNQSAASALFPGTLVDIDPVGNEFSLLGGIGYVFPQGRNATQYAIADDFSWTKGKHTLKFGYAFKKDDITDYDVQVLTNPLQVAVDSFFSAGDLYYWEQDFPDKGSYPVGLYSEGFYAQDGYKAAPNLLLTAGVRIEHNSNATAAQNSFSRLNGSFESVAATNTLDTPYNTAVISGQHQLFNSFQKASVEPRIELVWSPFGADSKTVVRGGFGMFSDVFPGQVADDALSNIPQNPSFTVYFSPTDPAVPGSSAALASSAATAFKTGVSNFSNGATYNSLNAEIAAGFPAPSITTSDSKVHYPTYEEFSLQIQQQLNKTTSLQLAYVGNHGYHEPVVNGNINGFNTVYGLPANGLCGCDPSNPSLTNLQAYGPAVNFTAIPGANPLASFGGVTNISSTASSNYNGVVFTVVQRSKYVNAQINYAYSHSLDDISNGGFLTFTGSGLSNPLSTNTLAYNYGNSDYDVRHSLNGNYVAHLPYYKGPKVIADGWTIAGTVFYRAGFPFTVTDSAITNEFANFSGSVPALIANPDVTRHCGKSSVANAQNPTESCFNAGDFTDPTTIVPGQRNHFYGPHFFNTDLTLNKSFSVPHYDTYKLVVGAVFYNVLNHPNFANPVSDINNSQFGQITGTVGPPTSIYGSGLGGDASPRTIQLNAKFNF
jgi:hypothetical protein